MAEKQTYSKEVIEIADMLFAEPDKKIAEIMRVFAEKCGKSPKTIERWVKKAKICNKSRIETQEKAKSEILVESAKESIKSGIGTKDDLLKIYWDVINDYRDILSGRKKVKKIGDFIIMPTITDIKNAGAEISKIQGYYAPTKNAQTDSQGNDLEVPLTPQKRAEILQKYGGGENNGT